MSATLVKSVRALALLGGIGLALTGECQPLFLGVFFSFFLIGLKIADFPALSKFFGAAQPFLAVFILAVAFIDFFYLSNSFLLTVAHFLLSVQGVRLLALRTNRENFGSVLLSSLMMLSASTLSVDWTYFLMLFVFLVGVIWTLMLLTLLEENKEGGIIEGSLLWRDLMPVLRGATAAAFLVAFSCCAVVFVFFPRFNFQGFRGQFLQPVHKSGFTSQVDLGGSGKIFEDNSIVMRVEIDPKDRPLWTGYLRGRALEQFNGKMWEKYPARSQQVFHQGHGKFSFWDQDTRAKRRLRQRIYLESMDSSLLFAQSRPVLVEIDRPYLDLGQDGSFQRRGGDAWRVHYDVESSPTSLDPAIGVIASDRRERSNLHPQRQEIASSLRNAPRNDEYGRKSLEEELLNVPDQLKPMIQKLSKEIAGKSSNPLSKAKAFENYLRTHYVYSLERGPLTAGKNPLDEFLNVSKKGHCEYFAAAMCLMLRSQNIPARLATGFLSHEWNSRGHYFIVRMKHAHAWVEADIEPYGWIGFDPSPRDSAPLAVDGFMDKWSETMDYINLRWNRYILSYDFERQVDIYRSFTQQSGDVSFRIGRGSTLSQKFTAWLLSARGVERENGTTGPNKINFVRALLAAAGLGVGTVLIGWLISRWRRRADRVWFYRALVRRLEKRLGKKPDSQTILEYLAVSKEKLGTKAEAAYFLKNVYYRLRFDPSARVSVSEERLIQQKLRQI